MTRQDAFRPRWTPEIAERHAALGARLEQLVPCLEVPLHLAWIDAIQQLKRERGAVIMAHSYQSPEIFHGVADITGDSLALAQAAATCEADTIVLCGVHFMAETAKILAPDRTVLIPDLEAGCSLAASITADDVRALRARHPGLPVVSYVNTTAAVKAESDACCTSANASEVVEAVAAEFGVDTVIFLPDRFLGAHVATQTQIRLVQFHARVVAHPECPPEVLAEADFVGSTTAMGSWLEREKPERVALITECSMADNLKSRFPGIEFVKPCNLCPYMQRITLPNIHASLLERKYVVEVPAGIAAGARRALERMLAVGRRDRV